MNIAFVADSTIGLSPEKALEKGIYTVPQQVIIEGQSYRDYTEMTPQQVVATQLAGNKIGTSQIAPADLEALYTQLLQKFDRIISVHVSGKLSGTCSTARMIAEKFGDRIKVIDGLTLNGGLSFIVDEVRQRLAQGVTWERIEETITPLIAQIRGYVLPATLTYLHRGGRIGGLQHFLGSLLKILPILEVKDGLVKPIERVRGWHNGLEHIAELLHKNYPNGARVILAHAENPQAVEQLRNIIRQEGIIVEDTRDCGAAVAVHTGPGTVALFAAPR